MSSPVSDRLAAALTRARDLLSRISHDEVVVEKTIWGSPAGKKKLAKRLVAMLPPHSTYVEPFAGSAAVLFAKEPADTEAINDADPEIAQAYRVIKGLSAEKIERLRRMQWTGDEAAFKRLFDAKPTGELERLHRFLYLTHFSYGKLRGRSFNPNAAGVPARTVDRLETFAPRLKGVHVFGGDYEKVVRKYDGANTVFYFDPPYVGHNVDVGESDFDEERFFKVLKSLKGKFLLTYGVRGKLPGLLREAGFTVKQIRTPRSIRAMRGVEGPKLLTQLIVANYGLVEKLEANDEPLLEDWAPGADATAVDKAQAFGTFGGSHHYAKRIVPLIPKHTTYVEPFAGAAAVLYAKEPSDKEVVADLDEDVVFLHRAIKAMTPERVEALGRRFEWTCTEQSFAKARDMRPSDELSRFYKLVFVRTHARDCRPDGTHPAQNHLGSTTNPEKYLRAAERLKDVTVLHQDYRKTISQLDGADSFFFLDPPYPDEWYDKDAAIDLDEFVKTLLKIKGRFIAVLNDSPQNVAAFKSVGQIFRLKVREASGTGGAKKASRLFCANFKVAKSDVVVEFDDTELAVAEKAQWSRAYINDLPDGAFLHIEPGGRKDDEGKTVPRTLRHFPVRDEEGKLDVPHLRNAVSRIPQSKVPGLTAEDLRELQDEARALLAHAQQKRDESETFIKSIPLIKGSDPEDERYVLGVVLEPDVVDAQGDVYSADEVRQAAHRFMEEFGGLGLMHRFRVNDQVKVLETYLAPAELSIGEVHVHKGTWLLAVRVLSDELWEQVGDGRLTGFSIGGSARRVPENGDREPEAEVSVESKKHIVKGQPAASSLRPPASTNRLLDIVVEEVSLVDRAANKHRFLIVKRSDDMDDETTGVDDVGEDPNATEETTSEAEPATDDSGDGGQESGPSPTLASAVEALEALTDAVEGLSSLGDESAGAQLEELASELARVSELLATSAKLENDEPSPDAIDEDDTTPTDSERRSEGVVAETIAAVRGALERFAELVDGKPDDGDQDEDDPTEGVESFFPLPKLPELMTQLETLLETVREQQKRLARLEKRFGLPNSAPSGERPARRPEDEEVSWPLDLNRGLDRESVDKEISFHEV